MHDQARSAGGQHELPIENRAPELEISIFVMCAVSLLFLVARVTCKLRYGKKITLDDHILVFSWVFLAIYAGTIVVATKHGIGRHIDTLPHEDVVRAHYLMGIADAFNILSISGSKTSFAVTILRLSSELWQISLVWFIIVTSNLLSGLSCIFIFTSCSPCAKVWDNTIPGTCMNALMLIHFYTVTGAWSAVTDFILAMFPWVLIWGLSMRKAEKIGICVAMSLGVISGITAAIKSSYISQGPKWTDWTYLSLELLIWAGAETAVVIVAASIPFLRLALKDATSDGQTSRSYDLQYITNDGGGGHLGGGRSRNRVTIEARGGKHRADDRSDKSILGEGRSNAVTKTQAVAVSYCIDDTSDLEGHRWNK